MQRLKRKYARLKHLSQKIIFWLWLTFVWRFNSAKN